MNRGTAMPTVYILRGLPGSGKTFEARAVQADVRSDDRECLIAGRDHLRLLLDLRYGDLRGENLVTAIQAAMIRTALRAGADVAVDDMNLHSRDVRRFGELASQSAAGVEVIDMTNVDVELCVERDVSRPPVPDYRSWQPGFQVGEQVIRDKWTRLVKGKSYPLPVPEMVAPPEPYAPPAGKPVAILVDIDGTVALHVDRSPYDETRVSEDVPNEPIIAAVLAMRTAGYRVIFMSGRSEGCRAETEKWLDEHVGGSYEALYMRPSGDSRRDSVVKLELFDAHVRHDYRVALVFDDRASVVRTWRDLGLTVAQVDEGNF